MLYLCPVSQTCPKLKNIRISPPEKLFNILFDPTKTVGSNFIKG